MRSLLYCALLQVLMHSSLASVSGQEVTYKLLPEVRPELVLPTYNLAQRQVLLDQARMVMEQIFVHLDLKVDRFGEGSNPLPQLDQIQNELNALSDHDLHARFASVFERLKDLHTSYQFPKPFACHRTFLPFSFKEVLDLQGRKVIAVEKLVDKPEVIKLLPHPLEVAVGDILISYAGSSVMDAIVMNEPFSRGANPEAVRRRAINLLSMKSLRYFFAPAEDQIELVFQDRLGKRYTVSVPWIDSADSKCLKTELKDEGLEWGEDSYQLDFNRIYRNQIPKRPQFLSALPPLKQTTEPILRYREFSNEYGNFGQIVLESFVPEKLSIDETVLEIKRIIHEELYKTDGLIFDVRNNGGGQIRMAENLVQLVTPKNISPLLFTMRASEANRHYVETWTPGNPFTLALREALSFGKKYTAPVPLNSESKMNELGQSYFGPVGIFTNSSCYSSCDMLSAQMQDHEAALVFGEDTTTGAGGANNMGLSEIFSSLPQNNKGPFKPLPGKQDIGLSFRQTVRVGRNAGKLIENEGVISDIVVLPSLSDLYDDSSEQLKEISRILHEREQGFNSWIRFDDEKRHDLSQFSHPSLTARWEGADSVEFNVNGQARGTVQIERDRPEGGKISLEPAIDTRNTGNGRVELKGSAEGKRVWRKILAYRIVPEPTSLQTGRPLLIDLNHQEQGPLAFFNEGTPAGGWNLENGTMRTGRSNEDYPLSFHAEASLFLEIPPEGLFSLEFNASVQTEENFDFFKVLIIRENKEEIQLASMSGKIAKQDYAFDLSQHAGSRVEIRFVFESDPGVTDKGVIIDRIALKPTNSVPN